MTLMETETLAAAPRSNSLRIRATDVTGSLELEAELQPDVPAGAVARMLAQRMELPNDVPWALRDDRGAFLDDERQLGEQLEADARVTLTPKTHLG
jgi:hypothetical protein